MASVKKFTEKAVKNLLKRIPINHLLLQLCILKKIQTTDILMQKIAKKRVLKKEGERVDYGVDA